MSEERAPFDAPKPSPWGALLRVVTEPTATFASMGEKPPIVPGYVLAMIIGLIAAVTMAPLTMRLAGQQAVATAQDPGLLMFTKIVAVAAIAFGALAGPWIGGVIMAVVCLFFGQFQGGGKSFGAYLGMLGYARLPLALSGLVQGLIAMKATSMVQAQTMSISLAALLPADSSLYLRAVLGLINPFSLWYYALLAIGFTTLHQTKPTRAAGMLIALAGIAVLFALGAAAFASNLPNMQPRM